LNIGEDAGPSLSIDVLRKGRMPGYVIAPRSLLEETACYISQERAGWSRRASRKRRRFARAELFVSRRGLPVCKNTYQHAIRRVAAACGIRATSHLLRATFGCWLLARLDRLEGLENRTCECYAVVKNEYDRLLPLTIAT